MINILIAEDHTMVREGIKSLLEDEPCLSIVAEACNGQEAIDIISTTNIDLAIVDINMPVMDGLKVTAFISENHKATPVLIISMYDHEKYLLEAFNAGAKGFILKNSGKDELVFAIKKIANGEVFIPTEQTLVLMDKLKENLPITVPLLKIKFTERERLVLKLISEGYTNSEIADKIFISKRTVETHRRKILEKTNTSNTATLIKFTTLNQLIG